MALVSLQDVAKSFGAKVVLDGITLDLHHGEKVGLIGANGVGKTTLFGLILGQVHPDRGTITRARHLRIGYLPQEPVLEVSATLFDEVAGVFEQVHRLETRMHELAEQIAHHHDSKDLDALMREYDRIVARFEAAGGYDCHTRINEVLGGLGFSQADRSLPIAALSGGQKCRVALAKVLLQAANLLLLDEPTNHLDMQATAWLEKWLAGYPGSAVIISHDRYLLDRVVGKIIEIEDRQVHIYGCSYSHYAEAKRARLLHALREFEKQHTWLQHQREYIARTKADKSRAGQARGRRWYIERMERQGRVLERPRTLRKKIRIDFEQPARGGDMVLRCQAVSKRYGPRVLFEGFDLEVYRGQKIGILGPNGSGKTTLLRMVLGQIEADEGEVRLYENLTIGYFDQEHAGLNPDRTLLEELRAIRPECTTEEVRSYLGGFLFSGEEVFKRIGDLSGGEQSRVLLAMLVWTAPQVLILDEPTNHLDIPSREVLEEALIQYQGTILLVSHDRYFLNRVVNRLVVLHGDGRCEVHSGTYDDYVRRQEEAAARRAVATESSRPVENPKRSVRARRTPRREPPTPVDSPWTRMSLHHLEQEIIAREERIAALERQFMDEAVYRNGDRVRELRAEHARLRTELDEMNRFWEELAE